MPKISYKEAGVDIDAGNSLVENIKPIVKKTFTEGVLGGIGSFAGAFELPSGYKNPILLAGTDGVGTKLKLAIDANRYDTIGVDLVAMCVNDLICSFAKPLFFLDYYATGKLDVSNATEVIKGISKGCIDSGCALIGGESAEMPGMYSEQDFDLAGFCVGIAEKDEIDRVSKINDGDILIALPSSGIHSNGYSLVRKVINSNNIDLNSDFNGKKLIDILLEPTKIYVKDFLDNKNMINALAHITGGGIVENLPRVLPNNLKAVINKNAIKILPIFEFLSQYICEDEMFRAFNMGVGLVMVIDKINATKVLNNTNGYIIGEIKSGNRCCELI